MDRRRDPDLGIDLLVLDRRTGRERAHLLRSHPPAAVFGCRRLPLAAVDTACEVRHCALPAGALCGAEDVGADARSGGLSERA